MSWKPFYALPNYIGGKRRLLPVIFREIAQICPPPSWPELTIIDPCAGACSASLYAKAQGLRVIAGDIAQRSYIVQAALIENATQTLDEHDLGLLFEPRNSYEPFVAAHLVPDHFTQAFAEFLDLALANIADHPSLTKQALLKLLLYKIMDGPRFLFNECQVSWAVDRDAIEQLPAHHAARAQRWYLMPPPTLVQRVAPTVNAAVFSNGHDNLAHQTDAQELVEQWAGHVEIMYLDPPYPEVRDYEKLYRPLDSVFAGKMLPAVTSPWSTSRFRPQLLRLLEAAQPIPLWVISYGSVGVTLSELLDLVQEFRPAKAITLPYPHLQAVARQEIAQANREYIIVAKEP